MRVDSRAAVFVVAWLALFETFSAAPAYAYSQSTHLELIDLLWADSIRPLLLERYPQTTAAQLVQAHAYAYGGCLIQDIGYYPFGKPFISRLAHYVRSGDFVTAMLRDARDVNELAFAIGALSHYIGDSIGHSEATNRATALTFPKLGAKYGPVVTYEEASTYHFRTEFGFDVAQTASQHYASGRYRKSIGFHVARPLVYRAFRETYGLPPRGLLGLRATAFPSYHWSITSLMPAFLRAQIVRLGDSLPPENHDDAHREFSRNISQSEYATQSGASYRPPGVRAHLLAGVIWITPRIGPLKVLAVESPSAETADLFLRSMNHSVEEFRRLLAELRNSPVSTFRLENRDLDTGAPVEPGVSRLVDQAHAELAIRIAREKAAVPAEVRAVLLKFYADGAHPPTAPADKKQRRELQNALGSLRRGP